MSLWNWATISWCSNSVAYISDSLHVMPNLKSTISVYFNYKWEEQYMFVKELFCDCIEKWVEMIFFETFNNTWKNGKTLNLNKVRTIERYSFWKIVKIRFVYSAIQSHRKQNYPLNYKWFEIYLKYRRVDINIGVNIYIYIYISTKKMWSYLAIQHIIHKKYASTYKH